MPIEALTVGTEDGPGLALMLTKWGEDSPRLAAVITEGAEDGPGLSKVLTGGPENDSVLTGGAEEDPVVADDKSYLSATSSKMASGGRSDTDDGKKSTSPNIWELKGNIPVD